MTIEQQEFREGEGRSFPQRDDDNRWLLIAHTHSPPAHHLLDDATGIMVKALGSATSQFSSSSSRTVRHWTHTRRKKERKKKVLNNHGTKINNRPEPEAKNGIVVKWWKTDTHINFFFVLVLFSCLHRGRDGQLTDWQFLGGGIIHFVTDESDQNSDSIGSAGCNW